MKAISIKQPWAWAVVNGFKPIENRSTDFVGRYRGPVLIHAGKIADPDGAGHVRRLLEEDGHDPTLLPDDLPLGGIVGRAEIVRVVIEHTSRWFFGPTGIVLAKASPMKFHGYRGQLGLFEIDERQLSLMGIHAPAAAGQEELFG